MTTNDISLSKAKLEIRAISEGQPTQGLRFNPINQESVKYYREKLDALHRTY
jgi:hypothetical protein